METSSRQSFSLNGQKFRSELKFLSQVVALYVILITSLVNLTVGSKHEGLWLGLVCSSLGCLLPSPRYAKRMGNGQVLNLGP